MKVFNFQNPCPKCGQKEASVKYDPLVTAKGVGSMKRACPRCGYTWSEQPLDWGREEKPSCQTES